jgi:sensor c-di-GMP phosphodiesterase-like protein
MMRKVQRSLKTIPLLAVLAVIAGIGGGVLLGRLEVIRQMRGRMEQYAGRIILEADASSREARQILTAASRPLHPICSNPDIDDLRRLVFESEYLKDAGRIRDGKIVCSAIAWRLAQPEALPPRSFVTPDGLSAYAQLAPPDGGGRRAFALALGESYVVFSPFIEVHRPAPPIRYNSSAINSPPQKEIESQWPELGGPTLTTNSSGQRGSILYATRCSVRYYNCVTGWMPIAEVVRSNRLLMAALTVLGALSGVLVAIGIMVLRTRGWEVQRQLRRAIRRGEIELLYQPIVDLKTRRIVGAEALARWTDQTGKLVSPEIFVPLAVRSGLIGGLTRLVVWRALHELGALLRGPEAFQISVNVTAEDLTGQTFVDMLKTATYAEAVDPGRIAIEITEISTARGQEAETAIQNLRAAGYGVHIDDFGTGYSSLSYLQDLAVNAIKIDRSFTRAVGTGAANTAVLPRILAMAEALNLEVVVEGIETEDQAAFFAATGQPLQGQGWLFGRPMKPEDLERRVRQERQAEASAAQCTENAGQIFSSKI